MTCRNLCYRYKATKPANIGRYISGQKRCNFCDVFINWDGFWCPCCHYRLRLGPRNSKDKQKILEISTQRKRISKNVRYLRI
ncbi:MAG: hypothetical protein FJ359_04410 [Thaumarchaeota archaeon]|nr:hypothetical protein [Nitrososphaerota archaeon]